MDERKVRKAAEVVLDHFRGWIAPPILAAKLEELEAALASEPPAPSAACPRCRSAIAKGTKKYCDCSFDSTVDNWMQIKTSFYHELLAIAKKHSELIASWNDKAHEWTTYGACADQLDVGSENITQ
jgi:hypothetical protein